MKSTLNWVAVTAAATACTVSGDCTGLPKVGATSTNLNSLLQIVFGVFGALAVLMIVISAFNFINSEGDSSKVSKARSTIIYALVGLVLSLSAEAVVTLVLGRFK